MVDQSNAASIHSPSLESPSEQTLQSRSVPDDSTRTQAPVVDEEALALVTEMVKAADDRKAADITVLNVADVSYLADYFVVVTGFSSAQVRAIARSIQDRVEENLARTPYRIEGLNDGGWVLLDYGESIIHIFLPDERDFYKLEAFWGHAEQVDVLALLSA